MIITFLIIFFLFSFFFFQIGKRQLAKKVTIDEEVNEVIGALKTKDNEAQQLWSKFDINDDNDDDDISRLQNRTKKKRGGGNLMNKNYERAGFAHSFGLRTKYKKLMNTKVCQIFTRMIHIIITPLIYCYKGFSYLTKSRKNKTILPVDVDEENDEEDGNNEDKDDIMVDNSNNNDNMKGNKN